MVQRKRHLAKAVTYRVLGSTATAVIAYGATGDAHLGAAVGVADTVLKVGLYYFHERVWYRIGWGVQSPRQSPLPASANGETLPAPGAKPPA